MTFSDKLRIQREKLGLNQQQLAELMGVSRRSIVAWETTEARPRDWRIRELAELLNVSEDYLSNDNITDPQHGSAQKEYIEETRTLWGDQAAKEINALLKKNVALFAGGEISQPAKDAYFEAIMKAYLACKEEAKKTYGRKQ